MRCYMGLFDAPSTISYNTPFTQGGFVFGNGVPSGTGTIYTNGYTPMATQQINANTPLQTTNIAQTPTQYSSTLTAGLGNNFASTPANTSTSTVATYLTPSKTSNLGTSATYFTPSTQTSSAATKLVYPQKLETNLVKLAQQNGVLKGTGTGTGTNVATNYETPSQTYQNWANSTSFGLQNSTWQGLGQGFQLANTVFNGVMGYLNYRQAKKAAEEQKALNHANYAAAAKSYNNGITSGNYIGRALVGKSYNDEDRARDDAALNNAKVSETY